MHVSFWECIFTQQKIRFGNVDIMNYTQVFCGIFFNTTSALYLLEIKMHNGFQVVHSEFLKTVLSVFYKRIQIFLEFFSSVYSTNFASFLGKISPNFRYHKVEKQNPCWCIKIY